MKTYHQKHEMQKKVMQLLEHVLMCIKEWTAEYERNGFVTFRGLYMRLNSYL